MTGARSVGLLLLLLAGGCGYHLAGMEPQASGARNLWLAPVDDRGSEPLFGAVLAREVARQVANRADTALVPRTEADFVLEVRVDGVGETGAAYRIGDVVREYVLTGRVTATVTRPGGEILWHGRDIRADREFAAGVTVDQTEANKDAAFQLLARDLARDILRRTHLAALGQGR